MLAGKGLCFLNERSIWRRSARLNSWWISRLNCVWRCSGVIVGVSVTLAGGGWAVARIRVLACVCAVVRVAFGLALWNVSVVGGRHGFGRVWCLGWRRG